MNTLRINLNGIRRTSSEKILRALAATVVPAVFQRTQSTLQQGISILYTAALLPSL